MATYLTSNTGSTKSTDRTAGGSKPDNTPATGTTTTGGGGGTGTVTQLNQGTGITLTPSPITGIGTIANAGVTKIISGGSNVSLSPTSGVGDVTISVTGGGGGSVSITGGTGITVSPSPITSTGSVTLTSAYAGNGIGTVNGIAKGNGSGTITAATSGTDYAPATSGTSILYGNGSGGFSNVTVSTGLSFTGGVLTASGTSSGVSSITGNNGITPATLTTGAVSLGLAAITPTSVNGITLSGSGTPTLSVTGTSSISGSNTGDQTTITGNAGTATKLATGRTISITGDLAYTSPSFDGSANVTAAGTLASVVTAAGPIGSSTTTPVITIDAKGRVTALSSATIAPPATLAYTTIAGLRAASYSGLTNGTVAIVAGALTQGDGGGQTFIWNSTSTANDNGGTNACGTIINPTGNSGAGRWLSLSAYSNIYFTNSVSSWVSGNTYTINQIVYDGSNAYICILATSGTTAPHLDTTHWSYVTLQMTNNKFDVRWFGAIPNQGGTNASIGILDAWNALTSIQSYAQYTGTLYFPAGLYYCKTACDFTKNVSGAYNYQVNFLGDGPGATYIAPVLSSVGICWKMGNTSTSQSITTLTVSGFSFNGFNGDRYGSTTLQIQNISNCFVHDVEMSIQSHGFNFQHVNYLSLYNTKVAVSVISGTSTGGIPYYVYICGGVINGIQAVQGGPLVNGSSNYSFPCLVADSCNSLRIDEVNFSGAGQYNSSSQYACAWFGATASGMNETSISGIFQDIGQGGTRSVNTCAIFVDGTTTYGTAKLQIHDSLWDIGDYGVVLKGVGSNVQQVQISDCIGNNIHYGVWMTNARCIDISDCVTGGATTSQTQPTTNAFVYIGGSSNEVHLTGIDVRNTLDGGVTWAYGVQIDGTSVTGVSVTSSKFGVVTSPIYLSSSAVTTQYLDFYNNSYAINNTYYGKTGARVTLTSAQSIANDTGTPYAVTWGAAQPNDLAIWSSGSNTRLTVPAGIYKVRVYANIVWYSNNTGYRILLIQKNGSTIASVYGNAVAQSAGIIDSGIIDVVPGDYFVIAVQQSSGSSLSIDNGTTNAALYINP